MSLYAIQINQKGALALDGLGAPLLFRSKSEAAIRRSWMKGTPVAVSLTKQKTEKARPVWVVCLATSGDTYLLNLWRETPQIFATRRRAQYTYLRKDHFVARRFLKVKNG